MYRFVVLLAVFSLVAARAPIRSVEIESNLIDFGDDEESFLPLLQLNNSSPASAEASAVSNLFTLAQLTAVPSKGAVGDTIRYTLGRRVQNDRLVGHGADSKTWPTPQDVTLSLRYPSSGQGAVVTYVEIVVRQSSNSGKATVVEGGIAQRAVGIVVNAYHTNFLGYAAFFYGL